MQSRAYFTPPLPHRTGWMGGCWGGGGVGVGVVTDLSQYTRTPPAVPPMYSLSELLCVQPQVRTCTRCVPGTTLSQTGGGSGGGAEAAEGVFRRLARTTRPGAGALWPLPVPDQVLDVVQLHQARTGIVRPLHGGCKRESM